MPASLDRALELATKLIEQLSKQRSKSSSNFKFAFLFLDPEQRAALERVYRFCRVVDDIVDERPPGPDGRDEAELQLAQWRETISSIYSDRGRAAMTGKVQPGWSRLGASEADDAFAAALAESIEQFHLPRFAFDEIIFGCEMDLDFARYATLADLERYCYRVASCVGILCIGIFGDQCEAAQRYARHLGLALQYTNILRDIGEDATRGRVYLPLDLLARHGLADHDMIACRYDARFLAMAREFADVAESEYQKAWAELPQVRHRRALLPAEIMGRTYYQILAKIRAHRYNVFTFRASLSRRDKLEVAAVSIALTSLPAKLPGPLEMLRSSL
ncbi:phytoene/squalene synthase family protein [Nannocystaceae bacterium ST9]